MELTKNNLTKFTQLLPKKITEERDKFVGKVGGYWDILARKSFYEATSRWFHDAFKLDAKNYLYVEAQNCPIGFSGGRKFFGSKIYPDAALVIPNQLSVAIELDHGKSGSTLRNALGKATFSVMLGFDCAILLFFLDPPYSAAAFSQQYLTEEEKRILEIYRTQFKTTVHLI